jgi:hypothetical protein
MSEHMSEREHNHGDQPGTHPDERTESLDDLLGRSDTAVLQEPTAGRPARTSGRHLVNVAHLVMGIAFLGIVGIWLLVQGRVVGGDDVRWLLPVPWVLGGLAGLLSIATAGRRRRAG